MEPTEMREFIDMKITEDGLRYGLKCKRSECIFAEQAPKDSIKAGSSYVDEKDIQEEPAPKPRKKPPPPPPPVKKTDNTTGEKPFDPKVDDLLNPVYTGFFNDGRRHVDIVLAMYQMASGEANVIKATFFVNLSRIGIDMEFEQGVLPEHKALVFVKLHASDKALVEYGYPFGAEKLFKDKNLRRENPPSGFDEIFKYPLEKEWINLLQRHYEPPLRFSPHARSYIVYMLLYYTSFGQYHNYVGLQKLLDSKIILAAYGLHDGPYFYKDRQDFSKVNARQILFYNWVGLENLYKFQPLHLIHEYFGPKIAFYFAYYEFYNQALIPLAIFGILRMYPYAQGGMEKCFTKYLCKRAAGLLPAMTQSGRMENPVCPACPHLNACHLRMESDDCLRKTMINSWDNIFFYIYSAIVCIWASFFLRYWIRKQNYFIWVWELCHPPHRRIKRPTYESPLQPERSSITGIWKRHASNSTFAYVQIIMGLLVPKECVIKRKMVKVANL